MVLVCTRGGVAGVQKPYSAKAKELPNRSVGENFPYLRYGGIYSKSTWWAEECTYRASLCAGVFALFQAAREVYRRQSMAQHFVVTPARVVLGMIYNYRSHNLRTIMNCKHVDVWPFKFSKVIISTLLFCHFRLCIYRTSVGQIVSC